MSPRTTLGVLALLSVAGCNDTPTTATGPQSAPPTAPSPTPVRYRLIVATIDTTIQPSGTVLQIVMDVRTETGNAVAAAEVDFGATEGHVDPPNTMMDPDGTVQVGWTIPPSTTVANLYGCARPPGQSCASGPLLKWNQ